MNQSIEGYPLFNEVEDKALQQRNRAVVIGNMVEDNLGGNGKMTIKAIELTGSYWNALPPEDLIGFESILITELQSRGLMPSG